MFVEISGTMRRVIFKFSLSLSGSAESHQVLAQLLDTLLVIGSQLPESPSVRQMLVEVACKVTHTHTDTLTNTKFFRNL